jgi:hypothetical protein
MGQQMQAAMTAGILKSCRAGTGMYVLRSLQH